MSQAWTGARRPEVLPTRTSPCHRVIADTGQTLDTPPAGISLSRDRGNMLGLIDAASVLNAIEQQNPLHYCISNNAVGSKVAE